MTPTHTELARLRKVWQVVLVTVAFCLFLAGAPAALANTATETVVEDTVAPATQTVVEDTVSPITESLPPAVTDTIAPITETLAPVTAPVAATLPPVDRHPRAAPTPSSPHLGPPPSLVPTLAAHASAGAVTSRPGAGFGLTTPPAPDPLPVLPAPTGAFSSIGFDFSSQHALLLALLSLAALGLFQLRLSLATWRPVAFISLLERPG